RERLDTPCTAAGQSPSVQAVVVVTVVEPAVAASVVAGVTSTAVSVRRPTRPPRSGRRIVIARSPWRGVVSRTVLFRRTSVFLTTSAEGKTALATIGILLPFLSGGPHSVDQTRQVVPMKVGVAKETAPGERRVALVPEGLGKLTAA